MRQLFGKPIPSTTDGLDRIRKSAGAKLPAEVGHVYRQLIGATIERSPLDRHEKI